MQSQEPQDTDCQPHHLITWVQLEQIFYPQTLSKHNLCVCFQFKLVQIRFPPLATRRFLTHVQHESIGLQNLHSLSAANELCDLRQVTYLFWALVSLLLKWANDGTLIHSFVSVKWGSVHEELIQAPRIKNELNKWCVLFVKNNCLKWVEYSGMQRTWLFLGQLSHS